MPVAYEITLKGERTERVDGADAYAQEGQLTTCLLYTSDAADE